MEDKYSAIVSVPTFIDRFVAQISRLTRIAAYCIQCETAAGRVSQAFSANKKFLI